MVSLSFGLTLHLHKLALSHPQLCTPYAYSKTVCSGIVQLTTCCGWCPKGSALCLDVRLVLLCGYAMPTSNKIACTFAKLSVMTWGPRPSLFPGRRRGICRVPLISVGPFRRGFVPQCPQRLNDEA